MNKLHKIYQQLSQEVAKREAARTLHTLPDSQLADLGMNRYEIETKVYGDSHKTIPSIHYIDIEDRHIVGTLMYAS